MNDKKKMKNAVTYPEATDSERKFNKGTRSNSRYMITLFATRLYLEHILGTAERKEIE